MLELSKSSNWNKFGECTVLLMSSKWCKYYDSKIRATTNPYFPYLDPPAVSAPFFRAGVSNLWNGTVEPPPNPSGTNGYVEYQSKSPGGKCDRNSLKLTASSPLKIGRPFAAPKRKLYNSYSNFIHFSGAMTSLLASFQGNCQKPQLPGVTG